MDRIILIKYGELSTKKGNRNYFINTLCNNIKKKLEKYDFKIEKDRARMYISFKNEQLEEIKQVIDRVFGIHMYHIAYIVESNVEDIKNKVLEILKQKTFNTFKIETKRSNKNFTINSMDMNNLLGGFVLKNIPNIRVDVHNPDILVKVEIREKNSYIYFDSYNGIGGYPVGTQSKGMLMLSGGIDSPVAGYLAMKRGIALDAIYFEAIPHTSLEARNKVIKLTKKLCRYTDKINLHIINFTSIQEAIYKFCLEDYGITIMRRMMYRIVQMIAEKHNALAIINGESIGQVASQTLTSMNVINSVVNIPVIRPVCCLDKLEIMDIARKIDTLDISILPYEDCCTIFVPKHPVINPKMEVVLKEEAKIPYENMLIEAVNGADTIVVTDDSEQFEELL